MSRTGRPKNTNGSLYQRGDSRLWWMRYRDKQGRVRKESTGQRKREDAEKVLRARLHARDQGLLPTVLPSGDVSFDEWADWFLEYRSKPPFRSEKTHLENLSALKFLRPRYKALKDFDVFAMDK